MGIYTRPAKSVSGDGGTSYKDEKKLPAAELNADIDGLVTKFNGEIDKDNISSSAEIPNSSLLQIADTKVDDSSSNAAATLVTVDPGDTGTVNAGGSLPTDLKGELERLRYRIGANNSNSSNLKFRNTGGSMVAAGWLEPSTVGRNIFPNSGFEVHTGAVTDAPEGWTIAGTPTRVAIEIPAHTFAGLEKRSLNIVANASSEGIKYVARGLKKSTKYLIGMAYTLTAGTIGLSTTGALGSGDYQNLTFADTSIAAGFVIFQGIVKTDTTPTDITTSIVSSDAADDFNLYYVWFYEMSDDAPIEAPHIPMQTKTWSTATTQNNVQDGVGVWENHSELSLTQYFPHEGYRATYEVTICFESDAMGSSAQACHYAFRLQQKIDGGAATTVEGPLVYEVFSGGNTGITVSGVVHLKYVIENPTPGASYEFTFDAWMEGNNGNGFDDIIFNPIIGQTTLQGQSSARLIVERI